MKGNQYLGYVDIQKCFLIYGLTFFNAIKQEIIINLIRSRQPLALNEPFGPIQIKKIKTNSKLH